MFAADPVSFLAPASTPAIEVPSNPPAPIPGGPTSNATSGAWPQGRAFPLDPQTVESAGKPEAPAGERLGGAAWVAASRFLSLTDAEVTARVMSRVQRQARLAAEGKGPAPVVIFDLDYTIYNNDPRMLAVVREWAQSPAAADFPVQRDAILRGLEPRYDLGDTLKTAGLDDAQVAACKPSLLAYFKTAFFDDAHALLDTPYPGAVQLVHQLVAAGAKVVYLTGRIEPQAGKGTRQALVRDGIGEDGRNIFVMLKASERDAAGNKIPDEVFKEQAGPAVAAIGEVVAAYDNEPANILTFARLYPNATNVFFDTRYTNNPVPVATGLCKAERFVPLKAR